MISGGAGFRFRLACVALVVQEEISVRNFRRLPVEISDLSGVKGRKFRVISGRMPTRRVTAKSEGMGEIMGFWEAATDEAGKEYGKLHAARIAKWEKTKRSAGWVLIGVLVLTGLTRAYGPAVLDAVRTPLLYGLGALVLFAGTALFLYAAVRIVRTNRRRTVQRSYRTEQLYDASYDGLYNGTER